MSQDEKDSAPIQLIQHVWDHALVVTGHSWARLNRSLRNALVLAIDSGMKFGRDDFKAIQDRFRPEYWLSNGEGIYSTAVESSNDTAAIAFEKWKERKPFFFTEIWHGKTRGKQRLHVGDRFQWKDEVVTVTSFSPDQESLVACSYQEQKPTKGHPYPHDKVLHRYVVTRLELAKAEKAKLSKVTA